MRDNAGLFTLWTTLVAAGITSLAPTLISAEAHSGAIEAYMSLEKEVAPDSVTIAGCDFAGLAITGDALLYSCAPQTFYEVGYLSSSEGQVTRFGVMFLRKDAAVDVFSPLPLYELVTSAQSAEEAQAMQVGMEPLGVPLALSGQAALPAMAAAPQSDPVADAGDAGAGSGFLTLRWPTSYGTLSTVSGDPVEISRQSGNSIEGKLRVTGGGGEVSVKSNRNDACTATVVFEVLDAPVDVSFACEEHQLTLPTPIASSAQGCRTNGDTKLSCLLETGQAAVDLDVEGWGVAVVALASGASETQVDLGGLRPEVAPERYKAAVAAGMAASCVPRKLDLLAVGYCSGPGCSDFPKGPISLTNTLSMPTLGAVNWRGALPNGVSVQVVETSDGIRPVGAPMTIRFEDQSDDALLALIAASEQGQNYPLDVVIDRAQYKDGRQMRFFSDNQCASPIEGKVDMSFFVDKGPDVPQCSFFQIFDGDKVRSNCTQVAFDPASERVEADAAGTTCSSKRVVVMVSESRSLNGNESEAIRAGLEALATTVSGESSCVGVDIVRTKNETREILLTAEDMNFVEAGHSFAEQLSLDFVNESGSVLRDFEWVYRTWGDNLVGVVLIADGSNVRPTDMIDSPAAMAWKIKNVATHAISFAGNSNCEVFENTLLFANCDSGDLGLFESQLAAGVAAGLQGVGDSQE